MEKNSDTSSEPGSLTHANKDLRDAPVGSIEGFRAADSGLGPSVVGVSSEVDVRQGDVGQIQDLSEASLPTQTQSDQNGIHAARPTSSQWMNEQDDDMGNPSLYEEDPRPPAAESMTLLPNSHRLSFSCKEDVPEKVYEEWKKQGEGKPAAVVKFYSAVADFLEKFEQQKDYNLLPLQGGLIISLSEVTKDGKCRCRVVVKQWSREYGTFWLNAKLSEDNTITYRKDIDFEMRSKLGRGSEGTVYVACDKERLGVFAAKQVPLEKFCANKTDLSAFLRLAGCEQICSPYGVLLDEEEECVLFLMEKLKGETLKRLFDRGEQIGVRRAVVYAVQIMQALQHIHNKKMVYTDVKESNVIIINDGRDAIAIDITGVKSPPSIMQYNIYSQVDMMHAILLLNKMLLEPQNRNSSVRWKPSDADRDNFNSRILDRLENLVSKNYGPYSVEEPLKELQEILEELPGPKPVEKTSTPGHPHESNTGSCEISSSLNSDGIPSPFYLTGSSESENGQPAPGERELNNPIKARKEKQNQTEILEKFPQQAAPMPYHPSQQGYGAPTAAYPYRSAPVALQELYTVPPAGQAATKVGPPPGLQMSVGGFGGVTIRIQSDALEAGCLIGGLVAGASAAAAFAASKVSDSAGGVAGAGLVAGVATGVTTLAAFYLGNRQQTDEAIREAVARDRQIQVEEIAEG